MIRTWCKDHPIQFMACYLVFYLAFFKLLEQGIQVPDLVLHCRLDDLIPFCKYAIIPYYLWFAWIPCTLFYLLWFNDRREFWRLCLPLFTGMTLSLLFCAIVPNGTDLRPAYIYGNDIFTRAVRALWRTDTSTNVFPSIHVFNSVTLALAYHHCARLRGRKWLWVRVSADLLCVSIILSTMLLKQHSVIDVMGGIILALTLDAVAARCADPAIADDLKYVLATANAMAAGRYQVAYCPSLVRGQGYYTGMVFEITCPQFSGAVAGGGRYDNMVGKFLGTQVPAVGFSIGFERVCGILLEQGYQIPGAKQKIVLLYTKDADFPAVLAKAASLRDSYNVTVLPQGKKLGKQLGQLEAAGFVGAAFMDKDEIKIFAQQ